MTMKKKKKKKKNKFHERAKEEQNLEEESNQQAVPLESQIHSKGKTVNDLKEVENFQSLSWWLSLLN